jgi:hypothetical protein
MHNICYEHVCYIYNKVAARKKNDKDAYQRLFYCYLGSNNVNNMASAAESKLNVTQQSGEERIFYFERYVRVYTEQHSVLNVLVEYGYYGIDESSKVRTILKGITTPQYDDAKARILASTELKTNFARSIELYKDFIKETKAEARMNARGKGGMGNGKGNGDGNGNGNDHGCGGGSSNSKRKAPEMEDTLYS